MLEMKEKKNPKEHIRLIKTKHEASYYSDNCNYEKL